VHPPRTLKLTWEIRNWKKRKQKKTFWLGTILACCLPTPPPPLHTQHTHTRREKYLTFYLISFDKREIDLSDCLPGSSSCRSVCTCGNFVD
jgi:hypothetical protein